MPRLFVAVDLPPALRPAIAALRRELPGAKWTDPAQLHVTLRFLGTVPDDRAAEVQARLAAARVPPFELAVRGAGVFPPPETRKPPRVLWLGLVPAAPLAALKAAIDAQVGPDEEEPGRGFRPHLTLARLRDRPGAPLRRFLAEHAAFHGPAWTVTEFHLYRSTLGPERAIHEVLASYPLVPAP